MSKKKDKAIVEGQKKIDALKLSRPDVVITVSRERDDNFSWDGDGPDPVNDGYYPYDVDVTARTIRNGEMIEGTASLGGSYYQDEEPIGEIHGYLPQKVDEAIEELDKELARRLYKELAPKGLIGNT